MALRHRPGVYRNLVLIFITTVKRHGPLIAVKRSTNFIKSGRIGNFFEQTAKETFPTRDTRKQRKLVNTPSVLIVTHVWNTSGVPILAELLTMYFNESGLGTGIWSIEKPIRDTKKVIGYGDFHQMKSTFDKLPDTIFLNTTCIEATFIERCCELLAMNKIKKLILYSHEDIVVMPRNTIQLLDIQDSNSCHIFAGSQKTASTLQRYFKNKIVTPVPYQIAKTTRIKRIRGSKSAIDFSNLDIVLVGSTADDRKGHVRAAKTIAWARNFQRISKSVRTSHSLREINFTIIGAQLYPEMDSISSKTIEILDGSLSIFPILEFPLYLEILEKQNVVICLSQYETLPLFVSEAMARGCVVVRNDCGGMKEQLVQGRNGVRLYNSSILNGFKIFLLAQANGEVLKDMSKESVLRFDEIHSSPWDSSFKGLF